MTAETLPSEHQLRVDLAALFRLAARFDMHEAVANHFSAAVSADGRRFLLNPRWRHFSRIRASELLLLDADDADAMQKHEIDPTAWAIHGQMHARLPHARVMVHLHPTYATALACLKDPTILPIDQNTARYFERVAIDTDYGGMADTTAEGARLAERLGTKSRMMMGNHGVIVVAPTVAEAFDDIYTLERASRTLMLAYASGRPLSVLDDAVAEKTARDWETPQLTAFSHAHFEEMKRILEREDGSYAD